MPASKKNIPHNQQKTTKKKKKKKTAIGNNLVEELVYAVAHGAITKKKAPNLTKKRSVRAKILNSQKGSKTKRVLDSKFSSSGLSTDEILKKTYQNTTTRYVSNLNKLLPTTTDDYYGSTLNIKLVMNNPDQFQIYTDKDGSLFIQNPINGLYERIYHRIFKGGQFSVSKRNSVSKEVTKPLSITPDMVNTYYNNLRTTGPSPGIVVFSKMGNCEPDLLEYLKNNTKNKIVLGMVAWLSNEKILNVLSENVKRMNFIVNHENYGIEGSNTFGSKSKPLVSIYNDYQIKLLKNNKLPPLYAHFHHINCHLKYRDISINPDPKVQHSHTEWIRAFGNDPLTKQKTLMYANYMHTKTIIICDKYDIPYTVVTGSYNYTDNAKKNIENITIIEGYDYAAYYFEMFNILMSLSTSIHGTRALTKRDILNQTRST